MRTLMAALVLAAIGGGAAHAQVTVISPSADVLSQLGLTNQVTEIGKAVAQLQQLQQSYQMLTQQYEAIAHLPQNIENMASGLLTGGLRNPLPSTQQLASLLPGGAAGNWSGLATTFNTTNRYADPVGDDPGAAEILRQRSSLSNVQAVALNNIQSLQQRASSLGDFLAGIGSSPDIQQTAAVQARLQLEQNFVATQQAQAQNLMVLANAEANVGRQRDNEMSRASADDLVARTAGAWQ